MGAGLLAALAAQLVVLIGLTLGQSGGGAANELAPWVTGGGAMAAVGGLVYIAKKLASGDLVARPVAEREIALEKLLDQALERQQETTAALADQRGANDRSVVALADSARGLAEVAQAVRESTLVMSRVLAMVNEAK